MEMLEKFINENECDYSRFLPTVELVEEAEQYLKVSFGQQLKSYLLNYGYLGYNFIELNGLNANQKLMSDLCVETQKLFELFDEVKGLVLIENQGDGDYYLVNEQDDVIRFCPTANINENLNIKLFDYIIQRFSSIEK